MAAGLHPQYLTVLTRAGGGSEKVKRLLNDTDELLLNEAIDESVLMRKLGRRALVTLSHLLDSDREDIQLRAAQDLADRSPHTAKTQKLQVESLTLTGEDVQALAKAMVEARTPSERMDEVVAKGLVEVSDITKNEGDATRGVAQR